MTAGELLLAEFDKEMAKTRKILECVPEHRFAWKPHGKSSTLGKLANHLATLPVLVAAVIHGQAKRMPEASSNADLLAALDNNVATGRRALAGVSETGLAAMMAPIGMTRAEALRERVMSHLIHHRGQMSVYLRLLDVSVPGMYGPSADEA